MCSNINDTDPWRKRAARAGTRAAGGGGGQGRKGGKAAGGSSWVRVETEYDNDDGLRHLGREIF